MAYLRTWLFQWFLFCFLVHCGAHDLGHVQHWTHTADKVELGEDAVNSLDGHVNVLVRRPDCVRPHLQPHQAEDM